MLKNTIFIFIFIVVAEKLHAQAEAIVHEGEFGASAGFAHYFGDINPNIGLKSPNRSFGLFYRKQYGNYISLRLHGQAAHVGYSDYRNNDPELRRRNLSFESDIYSLSLRGDFNFFKFKPGSRNYRFTPYVSVGAGVFWYNPYTYLPTEKDPIFLRDLTTEKQGYDPLDLIVPVGIGVKYNIHKNINIGFELTHYYTGTDYLDDVSKTYVNSSSFPAGSKGYLLFDRSDPANPYGLPAGKSRGTNKGSDTYVSAEFTIAISFSSYKCPTYY
jgi:hypothetical protein